jgi:hypothetical protein
VARIPKEVDPHDYPQRQRKPLREALAIAELPLSAVRTVEDEIVVGIELRLPASPLIRMSKLPMDVRFRARPGARVQRLASRCNVPEGVPDAKEDGEHQSRRNDPVNDEAAVHHSRASDHAFPPSS